MPTVLETAESFLKLVSKHRFPKLKDFSVNMRSIFANTCVCESTFSAMKQVKFKNRNRMVDKLLERSVREIVSEKPRPHASH